MFRSCAMPGGCHDEGVAIQWRVEGPIEVRARSSGPGGIVGNLEVVASHPGGQEICLLPVGGLLPC